MPDSRVDTGFTVRKVDMVSDDSWDRFVDDSW